MTPHPSEPSAITKVKVELGKDGLAYYTATYANGEPGPRSEGYGRLVDPDGDELAETVHAENLRAAVDAAARDFPDLPIDHPAFRSPEDC